MGATALGSYAISTTLPSLIVIFTFRVVVMFFRGSPSMIVKSATFLLRCFRSFYPGQSPQRPRAWHPGSLSWRDAGLSDHLHFIMETQTWQDHTGIVGTAISLPPAFTYWRMNSWTF
jgi:hypothetical protein